MRRTVSRFHALESRITHTIYRVLEHKSKKHVQKDAESASLGILV